MRALSTLPVGLVACAIGLLLQPTPAVADIPPDPPAPVEAATEAPDEAAPVSPVVGAESVSLEAGLRAEYLRGQPVAIPFTLLNTTEREVDFPALDVRPWLVRFTLTGPDGEIQSRYNTPPEQDPGTTWTIAPRGQRRLTIQIPSSAALPSGEYTVSIQVLDGRYTIPEHRFVVGPARPVEGTPWFEPAGADRQGHQIAWLHQANEGYDLYLHHASGGRPEDTLGNYHLTHFDERIEPVLSLSRPQERWDRYIYWAQGERAIGYVRLQGDALRDAPGRIELPWPEFELIGRGATDADGGLHVPIWIPAPSGRGGELRVASIRERGASRLRAVARMDAPPRWVEGGVDASGDLTLAVSDGEGVILYTASSGSDLPATPVRIVKDATPLLARFGELPPQGSEPGGYALMLLSQTEAGLEGRWYTLAGRELHRFNPLSPPEGADVVDALPQGYESLGLLSARGQSELLLTATGLQPRTSTYVSGATLCVGEEGAYRLRALGEDGGPVLVKYLGG